MTVDEELSKLEDDLRRLKIEYEVYFNGNSSRPPFDIVYRVEKLIKQYWSDQSQMSFGQLFKFNSLAQKYAVQKYICDKTKQIKASLGWDKVQFCVSIEDGKVKFKVAKA